MNCVMALGDVFEAAAAFKPLRGLVKAVKAGDAASALKRVRSCGLLANGARRWCWLT